MEKITVGKLMFFVTVLSMSILSLNACKKKVAPVEDNAATPVSVIKLEFQNTNIKFESVGSITSQQTPVLRANAEGYVDKILIKVGDPVKIGQTLITLSQKDQILSLKQAKARSDQADLRYKEAMLVAQRKGILAAKGIVSQLEYDSAVTSEKVAKADLDVAHYGLQAAEFELSKTYINSPINGFVQTIPVSVGDKVQAGTALIQLTNPAKLRATFPYSEEKALYFSPGQSVTLYSAANPNQSLTSTITDVTPNINPKNRAIDVIVDFDNTQNWKPGSSAHGYVIALPNYQALLIPESSLVMRPEGMVVFVVKNNKAYATPVQTGYTQGDNAVVLQGLSPGQLIVTDGADYLNNGSPVKIQSEKGK